MKKLFVICFFALSSNFYGQDLIGGNFYLSSGPSKYPELERAGSTIVFSTVNMAINTFGAINFNKRKKKSNAGFGIVCGAAQIANGIIYNEKETDLRSIDVSIGAATIIFNTIRIFKKHKIENEEKLSLAPSFSRAPFYGKITGLSLKLKF